MALLRVTSPHAVSGNTTAKVMQLVLLATLPGIAALTLAFGWGTVINIALASLFGITLETLCLLAARKPVGFYLGDYSALVTAVLLGIALPPLAPWWIVLTGMLFAIVIAKHLYGGLGYNPFNPAMAGYVVLLISFPVEMTRWLSPIELQPAGQAPGLLESLGYVFTGSGIELDGITMATPLDLVRQNNAELFADLREQNLQFGRWGGTGWEWANLGFLAGGIFLLYRKVYTWHAPVSMLASLALLAALFYDGGSSNSIGSPLFQLFSGASMLGAWFIVTDPVSSAVSNKGRIIYGCIIGALVYIIRKWGNYPDAIAFAVLLANFIAPLLDHYTQPKTYGHS